MRPKTPEVLEALKAHAVGRQNSVRSNVLAQKAGLQPKTVSNALNWLAVEGKNPNVKRAREFKVQWYRYWFEENP